jgi:hypothetical protein
LTGPKLAPVVYIAGGLFALVLFRVAGRSEEFVDGFLLMYGVWPFAGLSCVIGLSRLGSSLPPRLELITAGLWALSLNAFALSQRIAEAALASFNPALVQAEAALLWATAMALLATAFGTLTTRAPAARSSQIAEAGAFGVLGLFLLRAGAIVWTSTLTTQSGGIAAVVIETQLRLYVCIASTVAFGVSILSTLLLRRPWA